MMREIKFSICEISHYNGNECKFHVLAGTCASDSEGLIRQGVTIATIFEPLSYSGLDDFLFSKWDIVKVGDLRICLPNPISGRFVYENMHERTIRSSNEAIEILKTVFASRMLIPELSKVAEGESCALMINEVNSSSLMSIAREEVLCLAVYKKLPDEILLPYPDIENIIIDCIRNNGTLTRSPALAEAIIIHPNLAAHVERAYRALPSSWKTPL